MTPNRVAEYRRRRRWTLEELSTRAGLSVAGTHHIEVGYRRGNFESRWALAEALGAEYSELFPPVLERAYYERERQPA